MGALGRRFLVLAGAVLLAFSAGSAALERDAVAAPNYDIGFGIGPAKRFLGNRAPDTDDSGFGGALQLNADVALAPLVRVGAYAGFELSPPPTGDVKEMIPFGARVTITPPFDLDRYKLSFFAGLGYTVVYTHSAVVTVPFQTSTGQLAEGPALLDGISGSFFEIPFGARLSYKVRRHWDIFAELRATVGLGFGATLYNFDDTGGRPGHSLDGKNTQTATDNDGEDAFGLALLFGVQFGS